MGEYKEHPQFSNAVSKAWARIRTREQRRAFIASQINIGVPFQIRALMERRGLTQTELAARAGLSQPSISNLARPGKTKPSMRTLQRLADAFDCALMVKFVPFSELIDEAERFSPDTFQAIEFEQDAANADDRRGRGEA